jgi:methyl-accepting chemotaxis protein
MSDEDKKRLGEWNAVREALVAQAIKPAMADLKAQVFGDAEDTVLGVAVKKFAQAQQLFDAIVANELKKAESTRTAADGRYSLLRYLMIGDVLFALGLGSVMALYVNRGITGPLGRMTSAMRKLASGDLGIAIPEIGRHDEIGHMAEAVAVFKDGMIDARRIETEQKSEQIQKEKRQTAVEQYIATFERSVVASLDSLALAATEMRSTSQSMSATAEEASAQTAAVATAATQASGNVDAVAAAAEEMTTSVNEIGRQVQDSARIAGTAVEQARKTDDRINELSQAASRIGDVINLITSIAEQTNLLALNATIEAARAGEAGRGFAVVAQEVKQLASQTAKATSEIGGQITSMQVATQDSVVAIKEIGGTIGHISEIASAIAAAVEEQGAATKEIARNVQQAARGTEHVSGNIVGVNQTAEQTGVAADQVHRAAETLGRQAETLRADVDTFLANIRAA